MNEFTSKARRELIKRLAYEPTVAQYWSDIYVLAKEITPDDVADLISEHDHGDYMSEAMADLLVDRPSLVALAVRGTAKYRESFWEDFCYRLRLELAREIQDEVIAEMERIDAEDRRINRGHTVRSAEQEMIRDDERMRYADGVRS